MANRLGITSVRTELWYVWAEIAVEAAREARRARASYSGRRLAGGTVELTMEAEIKAALVAITASSHSLDAFFAHVLELGLVPSAVRAKWKANRTRRSSQAMQTLRAAFVIGKKAQGWSQAMLKLSAVRNGAVHYQAVAGPLVHHPAGDLATPVAVQYSAEIAAESVALTLDIITTCIRTPRAAASVQAWSRAWAHAALDFESLRSEFPLHAKGSPAA